MRTVILARKLDSVDHVLEDFFTAADRWRGVFLRDILAVFCHVLNLNLCAGQLLFQRGVFGGEFVDGKVRYDKRNKLIIAGLGGSMRYNNGEHQFTDAQMFRRMVKMMPRLIYNRIVRGRYVDILLTHAPPLGLGDGIDLPHKGFSSFLLFMKWFKPAYLLHGHIHLVDFNANRIHPFKQTKVINIFRNHLLEDDQLGGETDV